MAEKIKELEDIKLLAAKDSMGEAATGMHCRGAQLCKYYNGPLVSSLAH